MRRFTELLRWFPVVVLPFAVSSCTASLELDRFKRADSAVTPSTSGLTYFDLRFTCRSMQSHVTEYFELRIVDKDNRVQAKAVYADVAQPDFSMYLAKIVPKVNAPYRLDFWADHNRSFGYDGIQGGINEADHAWRRVLREEDLPEDVTFNGAGYELNFLHDTVFTDIFTDLDGNPIPGEDTLLPFNMRINGVEPYLGKMIEVRVVEKASGRLVGLHRKGNVSENYTPQILGILDEVPYEISIFADIDGDQKPSAGDPTWKTEFTSTAQGITDEIDLTVLPQSPIETGEPAVQ